MADIQYAGEYIVEECTLFTVGGLELDLREQLSSVTIYEDIFKNSITGNISFVDTNNLTANASIIGQEKLKLVLVTPNANDQSDRTMAINFSESPLHIYKINSKVQINDRTVAFSLSFTTGEMIRNNRIRVVEAFEGEPAVEMVKKILRDPELLDSKKEYYYEETSNLFKVVATNQRPFDFIGNLAKRCLSKEYDFAPTFLFYETVKGYFFRTLDSMMDRKNPRMIFREITPTDDPFNTAANLQNILSHEIIKSTDTLQNTRVGMYASKLMLLDVFNHDYQEFDFDYMEDWDKQVHVDEFNNYGSAKAPAFSETMDQYGKKLNEYPESAIYVQSIERDIPDGLFNPAHGAPCDYTGTDLWLQKRRSRFVTLDAAISLRIKVPGNTTIQAGDLIGIELKNQTDIAVTQDPYYSGRYVVRNLVHNFTKGVGQMVHEIHMDLIRDTIAVPYPSTGVTAIDAGNSTEMLIPRGSEDPSEVVF
jgi:hypothetical protein